MNRLIHSESLYLQQHAHNPVDWFPWGEEAFDIAKKENKPVLISIGYSSCHWCHVMERESFEDPEIAAYMNKHFVCIKVDREEHPEVDAMYMDALVAMTGQGGWPLNIFATADKKPFYGGTYFPPKRMYHRWSWKEILESVVNLWHFRKDEVNLQAEQLIRHLEQLRPATNASSIVGEQSMEKIVQTLMHQADQEFGGWGAAPKFPNPLALGLLMQCTTVHEAKTHLNLSLEKLIFSGSFDQVGGGWFRYSTDREWMVPHFEKMLYDNALMLWVCAQYLKQNPNLEIEYHVRQTLEMLYREWQSDEGLFYSAFDADSEGAEGKYYVWDYEEIKSLTTPEEEILFRYYHILPQGNWEGKNILHAGQSPTVFCSLNGMQKEEFERKRKIWLEKLFLQRSKRQKPSVDKKCQLSWNALLNIALSELYTCFDEDEILEKAISHIESIKRQFMSNGRLLHIRYAHRFIEANADDWAYFIAALLRVGSVSGQSEYIQLAYSLLQQYHSEYYDEDTGLYYFSGKSKEEIPVRKFDILDNPVPSVNAVMADNLNILGLVYQQQEWIGRSQKIQAALTRAAVEFPVGYSLSLCKMLKPVQATVFIGGAEASTALRLLNRRQLPQYFFLSLDKTGGSGKKVVIQTCSAVQCDMPKYSIEDWLEKYC